MGNGVGVISTELVCAGSVEQPEVIGVRSTCCAIIEVKVSRADFLADARKPERRQGGLGLYRFYLCPENLITPDDLPPGWGLIYAAGRSTKDILRPQGNVWPARLLLDAGQEFSTWQHDWHAFQHESNLGAERSALLDRKSTRLNSSH